MWCGTFGWLLGLVSPATVGLVSLRKDSSEGLIVTLGNTARLALYMAGELSILIVLVPLAVLLVVTAIANLLRSSASWQWSLLAAVLISATVAVGLGAVASADINRAVAQATEFIAQVNAQAGSDELSFIPDRAFVLGLLAWLVGSTAVCGLFLSRWWQALLFNPGGFQEEFHGFRLDRTIALILIVFVIAGVGLPLEYRPC